MQKNGADLEREYSKDLNGVEFSQELVIEFDEKLNAFEV